MPQPDIAEIAGRRAYAESMINLDCPQCRGQGFYLKREGHGYYRDGSFGHNQWEDCHQCESDMGRRLLADVQRAEARATQSGAST